MIKKIFKVSGITLGVLIVLLLTFALCVIMNGTCFNQYGIDNADNSKWMSHIYDDTLVSEIVMPGSHDAGSYDMVWLGETQQFDIETQLRMGVRYFDIRVNKVDGKFVIFHSIINGVEFLPILESIKDFIIENPTETLLLDFQHFSGNSQNDVYNFIKEYLYDDGLLVENNTNKSDLGFISSLKLIDARGKCIIFWGDRSSDPSNFVFLRNNDECNYENMCLNSYYVSEYHYNDYNYLVKNGYPVYFNNIINKIEKEGKGIFVLQAQLTDKDLIFGPYSKEKVDAYTISRYIDDFSNSENLKYLNVIMRDFLTNGKCESIINLNYYKNNCSELIITYGNE